MSVHSGKFATVNGEPTVGAWSINDDSDTKAYRASNTKGGTDRRPGITSWSGSFERFSGLPIVMPGTSFSFLGYEAPDSDVSGGTGQTYSGTALVDSIALTWNWQGGDLLKLVTNFSGHLALITAAAQAAVADNTASDARGIVEVTPPTVQVNGAGGQVAWPNVAQISLTISAANQPYVNSSTAGGTGRKPGNIDWTLTATEQEVLRTLFNKGDIVDLKLFIDATTFWILKFGLVKGFTNIRHDRDTGAIISRNVQIDMKAFDAAGVVGQIRLPGASSDFWP